MSQWITQGFASFARSAGRKVAASYLSVAVCLLAGLIGSLFTQSGAKEWYATLNSPSFRPPEWFFAPVWVILYILMGISAFIVWQSSLARKKIRIALSAFIIQLVLNAIWSPLFFGLHCLWGAFIDIILMWFAILATIIFFFRISKRAGCLLLPYIVWVTFAIVLNFYILILN